MTSASPEQKPLPLRHKNPPINPSSKPSTGSLICLGIIVLGYVIALGAPSLIVSPSDPRASVKEVVVAFSFTLLGVAISMVTGMFAFRKTKNWSWLIITGVPAVALMAGGAILAATKVITP